MGAYCASKYGMEAISDTLRLELQPWNISVSAIEPGFMRTPLVNNWSHGESFDRAWDTLLPDVLLFFNYFSFYFNYLFL